MGSLSNDQLSKLLNHFGIPDQGSRTKNISTLKRVADILPLPVKNEDRSTPAMPKPIKPTISQNPPSSRNLKSSRAPSIAPTEDSGYYSSTGGSAAGSTTSRPSTRSQTPAIRQQSTPSPSTPQDTPIVSPSQTQETTSSAHSTVIPPVDESPASEDQVAPATETPAEIVSEENLSVMEKKGSSSKTETISEENLGVTEKRKDKAKWKGKEAVRFDELSVVHEMDKKEDLYRDLYGIPTDSRIMPWSSMGGRSESNIGSSHSKRIESSSRDPEARPLTLSALTESSSSASEVTFIESVNVIGKDKMEKWNPDPEDYSSDDYECGHLDEYRVANFEYESDDDIDWKYALKLSELNERTSRLSQEQLDFYQNAWSSVVKAYKHNLERGISYEETGDRLYRGEPLIQE